MWNLDERLKNEPLYVRIYLQLKQMIIEGKYTEHQKMPSKRKLAQTLKVSPLTVDQAYQQLIVEGYVYSIEKSGFYANKYTDMFTQPQTKKVKKQTEEIEAQSYAYSFETHTVDTSLFPQATWAKLARQVLSENHQQLLNESNPKGLFLLRKEIARYLEIYRGMHVDINQIILGSGSTSLIGLIVEILGRNNHYAMENPGYPKIYQLFKSNDVKLSLISLDASGLSIDSLKSSDASIVHITPSHQYPSSIVMPISRRIELLQWASEKINRYIIEDDYDSEFRYQGKPIPAIHGLDQSDSIIYMNTFTKTLAPSFRINYMVLPKRLLSRYESISSYHGCTVPNLDQHILYKFMNEGHFERHVNRMKNIYKQKIDMIIRILSKYTEFSIYGHDSGLHFVLEIHKKIDEQELLIYLEKLNIKILSMKDYYNEFVSFQPLQLIIGYAGIPMDEIETYFSFLLESIHLCILKHSQ